MFHLVVYTLHAMCQIGSVIIQTAPYKHVNSLRKNFFQTVGPPGQYIYVDVF